MDNRSINSRLAKRAGINSKDISELTDCLVSIIRSSLGDLDTVAIPGFGSFVPTKEDEHVQSIDGRLVLMPPTICVNFMPGAQLKKNTRRL